MKSGVPEIYLDYQASTPCDPSVVASMMPFLLHEFANPSSSHHAGRRVDLALDNARGQIADSLGCFPEELIFTSGATESNNLCLLGVAHPNPRDRDKIICAPIEHKSVLGPCSYLSSVGYKIEFCPVGPDGQLDLGALAELIDEQTLLVSVQLANNEIGTIQPITQVSQLARRSGALVHSDLAQGFGKFPIDVDELGIDFASASAHKCYGPKGAGVLFARAEHIKARLVPPFAGGAQERGLRPGTQNVAAMVGFGSAARLCAERWEEEYHRTRQLRDWLEDLIVSEIPGAVVNGCRSNRLPNCTSITLPCVDAEALLANVPELCISTSSACNIGTQEPSHVLTAIGLSRADAYRTVRMAVGRFTTIPETEYAGRRIVDVAKSLITRNSPARGR